MQFNKKSDLLLKTLIKWGKKKNSFFWNSNWSDKKSLFAVRKYNYRYPTKWGQILDLYLLV